MRFQLSISGLLVLVGVVAAVLTMAVHMVPERVLIAVWGATLLLSYRWRSRSFVERSWKRILIVTAVTGAVWTICIVSASLMYVSKQELVDLLAHGGNVIVVGVVLALAAASLLNILELAVRGWLVAGTRGRALRAAVSLAFLASTYTLFAAWNTQFWHPKAVPASRVGLLRETATIEEIRERHQLRGFFGDTLSADRQRVAIYNNTQISVFDAVTAERVAECFVRRDERIASATFLHGSDELAAVVKSERGQWELHSWKRPAWQRHSSASIDDLLSCSTDEPMHPLLMDQWLLVFTGVEGSGTRLVKDHHRDEIPLKVHLVDVQAKQPRARSYPTLARAAALWLKAGRRSLPGSRFIHVSPTFSIAPDGQWIIAKFGRVCVLHGPGNAAPKPVPGPYFVAADKIISDQAQSWPVIRPRRSPLREPPFWRWIGEKHYTRLILYDCRKGGVVAESRWWPAGEIKFISGTPLVRDGDEVLLWDVPAEAETKM